MTRPAFHIITGEYPPVPGGVGDYSALLAAGLADAGAEAHVWTGDADASIDEGDSPRGGGVTVHRDAGRWSRADLVRIDAALDAFAAPRRLVVQYVPFAYGYKGLNLGFCHWLGGRRARGDDVRVMFHEVAYPFEPFGKPTRWVLAVGQRWMARTLLHAATRVDVAIPGWDPMLRFCAPGDRRAFGVRPVPSNVPVIDDTAGVAAVRHRVTPGSQAVLGSFGSFSGLIRPLLVGTLIRLLDGRTDRVGLLIGRGGDHLAAALLATHPGLSGRLVATGGLPPTDVSRHLQGCDLLLQPYPDGVSGRRGSAMAGLAHGVAIATNAGRLSETFWADSGAVRMAPRPSTTDLALAAEALLADPALRARVAAAGRALYEERFAPRWTVEALLRDDRAGASHAAFDRTP